MLEGGLGSPAELKTEVELVLLEVEFAADERWLRFFMEP